MPEYTSNYNLYKPNRNDDIVVDESLTNNFEKIDTEIKNRQDDIASNASNIGALQKTTSGHADDISTLQTNVSGNSSDITNLQSNVSGHTTDISNLQKNVSGNETDISNLQEGVSGNRTDISSLQTSVSEAEGNISTNTKDINTLNGNAGTLSNLATADQSSLVNAINEVNGKFIEINKGVFTTSGDGTATTATIPHGLSSAPAFYQVQEGSADAGAADISHVTVDATNITVTFKTAPVSGTDNVSLVWRAEL